MPNSARLFLVVATLLVPAAQAQPFLVEDILSGPVSPSWPFSTEWVTLGDLTVFTTYDTVQGAEIWRSDGTAAGTHPIADICPGICSSEPSALAVVGSTVFFGADDGVHGRSLWKTDGTAAGTVLVREVSPAAPAALGGLFVFAGTTPQGGQEIWRSDGTRAGTFALSDLRPGPDSSAPRPLGYAGSWLLFSASGNSQREVWRTDGTIANTTFLAPNGDFVLAYGRHLHPTVGGRLFYVSGDSRLWVSDGTPGGTYQVSSLLVDASPSGIVPPLAALGNEVYFSASDASGSELWKSDGTPAGTVRVKDINPGPGSSFPIEITSVGSLVFFRTSSTPSSHGLWRSDGTEAGTLPVEPGATFVFEDGFNGFQALGDKLVFFASWDDNDREPWVSDGTNAGTFLLMDIYPGSGTSIDGFSFLPPTRLDGGSVTDGEWVFRAKTPDGWGVWKSDGTPAGTGLVEQIHEGAGAWGLDPAFQPDTPSLADLNGTLFLATLADTGLWRSDGSEPGTHPVDEQASFQFPPGDLTPLGSLLFFTYLNLWKTDGTTMVADSATNVVHLTVADPYVFYVRSDLDGHRLERTDGFNFAQIINEGGTYIDQLTGAGSNLFFLRGTSWGGEELWKSSGAPFDAVELPIVPGMGYASPRSITAFGSSVFFSADDGSTGRELWFSNGTVAGTRRVKDIVPGPGSSDPRSIVTAGNLVFFVADDGTSGSELWRSDGTDAGTFLVRDIRPGAQSSYIQGLTAYGDMVVFAADNGVNGVELWGSYGSAGAAFLIKDIRPGAGSSFPGSFRVTGHTLLFAADDGTHGLEMWRTDGFAAGTSLVHDVFTGPEPSSPAGFTLSGDYLFFSATDQTHGFELWALDRTALGSTLAATKRVMGPTYRGSTVVYEIVITNTGAGPHPDLPGDEMVDGLPVDLALTDASSDVGAVTVDLPNNRVAWNGALGVGESATVIVEATVSPTIPEYVQIFNQASVHYDSDGNGTLEKTGVSSDPGRGPEEPTMAVVSTPPLDFHTVTPCRIFDTRTSSPLASGVKRTFAIAGTCGVPPTARSVAVNQTIVGATGSGHLVLYPASIPHSLPVASSMSFPAVRARANNATVPLASGSIDATATVEGGGTAHLILDVTGYFE